MRLVTVGHSTLEAEQFAALLQSAGIANVVDIRSAPGSRRLPHFGRAQMASWLSEAGLGYRWEPGLGGFRKATPGSPNTVWRHLSFRGYADHMATEQFSAALAAVLEEAAAAPTAVMCAEALWWRCHRRLVADAAVVLGADVLHLGSDGRLFLHRLTRGARPCPEGGVVYDVKIGAADQGGNA